MIGTTLDRLPLFERRPAFCMLLAVASGIAYGSTTTSPEIVLRIAVIAMPLMLCYAVLVRRQPIPLFISTTFACIGFGIILIGASRIQDDQSILARISEQVHKDEDVVLNGTIDRISDDGSYLRLTCDSITAGGTTLAVEDEAAGIFLRIEDSAKRYVLKRGMEISAFGELAGFAPQRNPYAFDYDHYLRTNESIQATMFCDSYFDIVVRRPGSSSLYADILDLFGTIRTEAKASIASIVRDTLVRGFLLAMVLGERKALPEEVWEDFQEAGLSHLLVVSGFNLGLIAWAMYIVLRMLRLGRREIRIVLVMVGAICYGALVGPQPSVIRAVIVIELILISRLLERKSDLTNITAGAALIDLALDPTNLFDVSFQLSYGAVFSLTLIAPALDRFFFAEERKARWYDLFLKSAVGTAAVLVGTIPVVLFHFHQLSLISILTNLLAIPLASLATIFSVLLVPLSALSTAVASLYVDAVTAIIYLIRMLASLANEVPFAVIRLPHPSTVFIIVYLLSLLYIVRAATRQRAVGRILVAGMLFFGVTTTGFGLTNTHLMHGRLTLMCFDVGQGDATFLATPNGKYYLIDAGGVTRKGTSIAERAIVPFLTGEQVANLNGAFATHMHLDHYAGFASVMRDRPADTIYSCGGKTSTSYALELDSLVHATQTPVRQLRSGDILKLDDEVTAYILSPIADVASAENERSLVMKIVYQNTSILLLADISSETEAALVAKYGDFLQSDLVKVAHHGSRSSSLPRFVDETQPRYALFSSGRRNRHGHPDPEVVDRWRERGAQIARTDLDGALLFSSDGTAIEQINWR